MHARLRRGYLGTQATLFYDISTTLNDVWFRANFPFAFCMTTTSQERNVLWNDLGSVIIHYPLTKVGETIQHMVGSIHVSCVFGVVLAGELFHVSSKLLTGGKRASLTTKFLGVALFYALKLNWNWSMAMLHPWLSTPVMKASEKGVVSSESSLQTSHWPGGEGKMMKILI